jgi:hypothetical protein
VRNSLRRTCKCLPTSCPLQTCTLKCKISSGEGVSFWAVRCRQHTFLDKDGPSVRPSVTSSVSTSLQPTDCLSTVLIRNSKETARMAFRYADTGGQTYMTKRTHALFILFVAQRGNKICQRNGSSANEMSASSTYCNKHAAEDAERPAVGFEAWPPGTGIQECHVTSVMNYGLPPEW